MYFHYFHSGERLSFSPIVLSVCILLGITVIWLSLVPSQESTLQHVQSELLLQPVTKPIIIVPDVTDTMGVLQLELDKRLEVIPPVDYESDINTQLTQTNYPQYAQAVGLLENQSVEETKTESIFTIVSRDTAEEDKARKLLMRAKRLQLDGVEAKSVAILHEALNLDAELHEARELLIVLLTQNADMQSLESLLDAGLQLDPQNEVYVTAKANMLITAGDYHTAIELLTRLIQSGAASIRIMASLAAAYQQIGEYFASAELYQQLLMTDSAQADWWIGLAISLENMGNVQSALVAYERAISTRRLLPELSQYATQRIASLRGRT